MTKIAVLFTCLALTLGEGVALAGPPPTPAPPAASGSDTEGPHFKHARAMLLRRRLGLEEKRAVEVERVLDKYAPERKKLREAMRANTKAMHELLKAKSDDQASYQRILDALINGQTRLDTLREQERVELAKLLTPKQQAQLLAAVLRARRQHRDQGEAP